MKFIEVYLMFWIFSFLGWVMEVVVCSIEEKKIINRGFLLGPYCPIYGVGGLVMLFLLPYNNQPLICFVLAFVLCSVIEYLTSYVMEKIFHVRFWDYSNDSFNINGRVCLRNALAFGFLGMLCTKYLYPFLFNIFDKLSNNALIFATVIVGIITLIDIIISLNVMSSIKKTITNNINEWKNRDATNDIKEMIKNKITNEGYLYKRIIKAYEYFSCQRIELFNKFDNLKERVSRDDIGVSCGTIIGIVITIILGIMTKKYKIWFSIFVPLGFFIDTIFYYVRRRKNGK